MDTNKELWERFDERRSEQGLGLVEFARVNGLSYDTLQAQYYSKSIPKAKTLYSYAKALKTTMDYLYAGETEEDEDAALFRVIASDQELIDICNRLVTATKEERRFIRSYFLARDIEKNDGSNVTGKSIS